MVNTLDNYEKWESVVGKGRILPAFSGAGGSNNKILDIEDSEKIQATLQLTNELAKGRKSGKEKGQLTLEDLEKILGIIK